MTVSWREAYRVRSRPVTLIYQGGPADGQQHQIPLSQLPQHRYWAPAEDRTKRTVVLARYVRHTQPAPWTLHYVYTGTEHRPGPAPPGDETWPEWS